LNQSLRNVTRTGGSFLFYGVALELRQVAISLTE
jgi:hypothetical protein